MKQEDKQYAIQLYNNHRGLHKIINSLLDEKKKHISNLMDSIPELQKLQQLKDEQEELSAILMRHDYISNKGL